MALIDTVLNMVTRKAKTTVQEVETVAVAEIKKIVHTAEQDVKTTFTRAREAALAANNEVNRLKAELQTALSRSRDLHQAAVTAAVAAQQAAEAEIVKFKQAIAAHTADMNTQGSQVVASPSQPEDDTIPTLTTLAPVLTMAQQFAAAQAQQATQQSPY